VETSVLKVMKTFGEDVQIEISDMPWQMRD